MTDAAPLLEPFGAAIVALVSLALAVVVSSHAVLTRRDGRSAIGWVGLVWLVPLVGSVLYVALGINRIRRRASAMRRRGKHGFPTEHWGERHNQRYDSADAEAEVVDAALYGGVPSTDEREGSMALSTSQRPLVTLGNRLTHCELTEGNQVEPLLDGDAAYPAMLAAIANAAHSVALASYIFDHDTVGLQFVSALAAAHERGVAVRVLVDAVGARYSWPRTATVDLLTARGVPARRFNPTRSPIRLRYLNLRSHRKIMVVDGQTAFTGGMNIRADCVLSTPTQHPTRDLHFQLVGPVVPQLMRSFAEDWHFTTGEELDGPGWWPTQRSPGHTAGRAILDGPDADFDKLRRIILGAISVARERICIATPYFLPDPDIVAALDVAALRGVQVDVLLPAKSNLILVQWAMTHGLWRILDCGCDVWLSPAPFDHTKLMIVDGRWALVGSGNWDPRSLRLNFELNVELHDTTLAATLTDLFEAKRATATQLTRSQLASAPLWARVRDGFAALGTPYL